LIGKHHDVEYRHLIWNNETLIKSDKDELLELCYLHEERKKLEEMGFDLSILDDREKLYKQIFPHSDYVCDVDDYTEWT
jgi:hypothetical protein